MVTSAAVPAVAHRDYDNSERRPELRKKLRAYLMAKYPDWNEEKLTYRKWKNE